MPAVYPTLRHILSSWCLLDISRHQTPDCQLNLNLGPAQSAMTLILNVSAKHPCVRHCHLKDNCFEQMSSSIQGRVERVQLWEMWSEIQTKSWHKSYFCFKRMFRSRKRTVTPYDDITEGLKDIYKKRLLPLEKVSWSWKPWCYRAFWVLHWYKRVIQSSTTIVLRKSKQDTLRRRL